MILKNMGGSHFALVVMVVGGGLVKFVYIVWGPLKKVRSSPPPPPIDLNGTALRKPILSGLLESDIVKFEICRK